MDLNKIAGTGKNSSLRFGKVTHSQYHLLTVFRWHKTGVKKSKDTGNPLFSPPGAYLNQAHLKGGFTEMGNLLERAAYLV